MDLWEHTLLVVLEITVARPTEYFSWTRWVHRFDGTLRLYNSDLMLAAVYCWERKSSLSLWSKPMLKEKWCGRWNARTMNGHLTTSCPRSKSCKSERWGGADHAFLAAPSPARYQSGRA